jgi:hypothetical protein
MSMRFGGLSIPMKNLYCKFESMTSLSRQMKKRAAFTLIELLALIPILVAMSPPSISQPKIQQTKI